ncbi:MAG: DUF4351 domain-containing protein [Comamonadaceae bacterium]|nr:DUF4351 domain-containing protein [Comamonadaceae bacterium]
MWTKQEVLDLYEFIDWLLALPEALEDAFLDEIHDLEERTNMRYISSAERIGMRRGTELGIQQGGATVLRSILQRRFGDPPPWVETKLQEGTLAEFEQWAKRSLDADTLEAVFKE